MARDRDFLITTGLKGNRSIRVEDEAVPKRWRWQTLAEYTANLSTDDCVLRVHMAQSDLAEAGACSCRHYAGQEVNSSQIVIARESLDAPLSQASSWASRDLDADMQTMMTHITGMWNREVLFGDGEELLSLDKVQLMSAIVRFWTMALAAYTFLDEQRKLLQAQWQRHATIGETRREMQLLHQRYLVQFIHEHALAGEALEDVYTLLAV